VAREEPTEAEEGPRGHVARVARREDEREGVGVGLAERGADEGRGVVGAARAAAGALEEPRALAEIEEELVGARDRGAGRGLVVVRERRLDPAPHLGGEAMEMRSIRWREIGVCERVLEPAERVFTVPHAREAALEDGHEERLVADEARAPRHPRDLAEELVEIGEGEL